MYINLGNNLERSIVSENRDLREVTEPVRGRVRIPPQVCVATKPLLIKDTDLINVIRNSKITTLQPVVLSLLSAYPWLDWQP